MGDMVMDNPNEVPESKIIITFVAPGTVHLNIEFINVMPLQVAAAAWYLDKQAEAGFFQQQVEQQQKAQMQKIAVPTQEVRKTIIKPQ